MIFMNYHSAKVMINHKCGIFRSTLIKREFSVPDSVPEDVAKFREKRQAADGSEGLEKKECHVC